MWCGQGSPAIKFIDFGGACTWTVDEGLVGLVGTPQYVAPEVVTGFGEVDPTEKPYGKGCDMWSMGVLLYVMLSKTMPFRAKEVDQLLKQVPTARVRAQCRRAAISAQLACGTRARARVCLSAARVLTPSPRPVRSAGRQGALLVQARGAVAAHLGRRARPHLQAHRARPDQAPHDRAGTAAAAAPHVARAAAHRAATHRVARRAHPRRADGWRVLLRLASGKGAPVVRGCDHQVRGVDAQDGAQGQQGQEGLEDGVVALPHLPADRLTRWQ
eukprot:2328258-Prymnesium_polylepis.1